MSFDRPTAADVLDQLTTSGVGGAHQVAVEVLSAALEQGSFESAVGNCHVDGMDSVVLFDDRQAGGGMLRFFFARSGEHHLDHLYTQQGHFTLGVHNHRYPLALVPLLGRVVNVETQVCDSPTGVVLHEYGFTSAIAAKVDAGLVDDDMQGVATLYRAARHVRQLDPVVLSPGDVRLMVAADLHTVQVPQLAGLSAMPGTAWLVVEGPDAGLGSVIYSPRTDLTISRQGLYTPMSPERAAALTQKVLALALAG